MSIKFSLIGARRAYYSYLQHGGRCAACDVELTFTEATIDHVTPRDAEHEYVKRTGLSIHDVKNLAPMCAACNSDKRETPAAEYYSAERLAAILKRCNTPLDEKEFDAAADAHAQANPSKPFAKKWKSKKFYIKDSANDDDKTFVYVRIENGNIEIFKTHVDGATKMEVK